MKKELLIGRGVTNDIVVAQSIVSSTHAKITFVEDGKIQIEDLNSTNHTFVNGEKILKKIITPLDRVTLGSYPLDTESLFKKFIENKTDFRKEFLLLKTKHEEFERQVDQMQKGAQTKPMYIKAGFTIAAMVVAFFVFKEDNSTRYLVMMGAGILGGFLSVSNKGNTQMKDEIDRLSVQLQREYKCPKCDYSLMGKRWGYWAGLGACPQCKAIWRN